MPHYTEYHGESSTRIESPEKTIGPKERSLMEMRDACKSCELACLTRPKYFCGQLLTEEDLQAEQRYQIEKNKLHNRYLHGWGVVCGLKVTCHPKCASKGNLLIEKGYAIDCCGNDIIVCEDEGLDVLEKIKECQPRVQEDECLSEVSSKKDECKDSGKKYCLIIKYKEEEARPVTALKRDEEGCSVKRCEPSRIKESYSFEVKECWDCNGIEKSKMERFDPMVHERFMEGTLCDSLMKCKPIDVAYWYRRLINEIPQISKYTDENLNQELHQTFFTGYCEIKRLLLETIKIDSVRCEMKERLSEITFPDYPQSANVKAAKGETIQVTNYEEYRVQLKQAFSGLWTLVNQQLMDCICSQFLYACPECSEDDNVVLACITVQGDKIKHICNHSRRQVMTFPKLFYWLPINQRFGSMIRELCCREVPFDQPTKEKLADNKAVYNKMSMAENFVMFLELYCRYFSHIPTIFTVLSRRVEGINAGLFRGMEANEAIKNLKKEGVQVKNVIEFDPDIVETYKDILSPTFDLRPGVNYDLVVKDEKVLYMRPHEVKMDEKTIVDLENKLAALNMDLTTMKSSMISMRRDPDTTIKLKANIEKAYQPLTIELVKGFTEKMQPEVLKDIDKVKGKELKKAGMVSVRDVFQATTEAVSEATKERVGIATKYIDYAEDMTMKVASEVYKELKRAKVTDIKALNKVDIKTIAKEINLPEETVKGVLNKVKEIK